MRYTFCRDGRAAFVALVALLLFPLVSAAQPTPTVSVSGLAPQSFIGEPVTFTVTFDNTSPTDAGYGPYIDVILPAIGNDGAGGATDDGLTFVGATYLGAPVTSTVLTFDGSGNATHPYARTVSGTPVIVTGTPGNQLVVLQLPFGSFTASQPAANVLVTTSLSPLADAGVDLTPSARGGFRYGADALDNPTTDPSIIGGSVNASTTPTVLRLRKTYIGPEDETATGPNFPRQYLIEVDIADGQTVTALDLTDVLPSSLQFVSVDSTTIRGSAEATTSISTPSTTTPGGVLTRRFSSVTGTTATNDATLLFTFYVPRVTSSAAVIIDPGSGDDATSIDDAQTQGTWTPIDARDLPASLVASNVTASDHVLTDKSIAIQKSVAIAVDTGVVGPSPGDVLEYTLAAQVSDFFAFQNLVITDVMSDGLRRDNTFTPTLQVVEHGSTSSAAMQPASFTFVVDSPGTGTTTGTFGVSAELIARALDGIVLGGCVPVGGTGGPVPDCATFNGGGTTIRVVYRAIIQDNYTDTFPSTDPSVDEGDVLVNDVTIVGDVVSVATLAPTGSNEADTSASDVAIAQGQLFKTVYAVNGSTSLPSPVRIGPGDTITYRLRLTLPTSDIEPLAVNDYLPLPIFDATTVTTFNAVVDATPPPSGQAKFGPDDTFFGVSSLVPTITTDATSNRVSFSYTQFDSPSNPSTTIDLLFTVTASDDPFADGLFLTNQANATQSTTQLEDTTRDAIVQIQLTEPDVRITKGVVATDAPSGVFAPTTVGPVTFSAPGSAGYRGSGTITSTNLATTPINSNLAGADAGDLVTFAIVLENVGSSVNGAFDIRVRDTLPAGFAVPSGGAGLNVQVTDGTGTSLPFTTIGTGLFDAAGGIELTDGATGALGPYDASNALNIAIITFDLEVVGTASPAQVITNTGTLFNFAGTEGGPDHTTADRTDPATVTIASPTVTKTITSTNQAHTSGNNVAIGEQVTYQVVVRVPEGEATTVTLVDTLPLGMAIVSLDSLTASGALSSSNGTMAAVLGAATISTVGASPAGNARRATLNFGTLTNSDGDDATNETITFVLTAVVINGGGNDRGDTRVNAASFTFTGGSASNNAPAVTIVEPTLQVVKTALPTVGDAGDPITFSVTLSHAVGSNTTAFEATLADVLPAGMTFVSATHTAGLAPTTLTPGGGFTADWASFPVGSTSTIQLVATLDTTLMSGQVLTNTAASTWTSLPGTVTSPQTPNNSLSTERTGSTSDPGGADNDYSTSGAATVTGIAATPTKSIVSTNLISTTGNDVAIGEQVQYQVQIVVPEGTNTNVTLVDTLDAGLSFVSFDSLTSSSPSVTTSIGGGFPTVLANRVVSNVGGGPENDGRRVTFDLGTVTNTDNNNATPETVTFVYTVVVINTTANVRSGLRNNSAVWTSDGSTVTASAPDITIVEPTLQVVKGAAPTSGDAGGTITFTLTVSHTGASNATAYDAVLADIVPAGMTYVPGSAIHTGGTAPTSLSFAAGTVTATYASLPVGQSSVIQFQTTLDSTPPVTPGQTITNTASLLWTSLPGDETSPQSGFNTLSTERTGDTGNPGGAANTYTASDNEGITVHQSQLSGFVYVDVNRDGQRTGGEPGIGGATVHLTGTDHLGNAVSMVTTTLGDGSYAFTGLRPGTYTITESQPSGYADGADTVGTPALGAIAGDDVLGVITIPVGANTNGIDFNFGELSSSELSVVKTGAPDSVLPGGTITYTIAVTNAGPNAAVNALLTDPLPGGTTFQSLATPGGWSCSAPAVGSTGTIACSTASFAVGTATFTLTVQANSDVVRSSVIHNVATVTSSSADTDPTNNRDDEITIVAGPTDADLEVTKTDSPDPAAVGQTVTYTITVRNHGPATTDATVTDTLPAALALVSATPSAGSCSAVNPVVCSIPGMTAGSVETITVQATALTSGVATNAVSVSGTQPDPNPANDQASEPTTIAGPGETDLAIVKTGPATVARGGALTYTLVVTNNGPNGATAVQVDDLLVVPGLTFVSNAGDCATAFPCVLGALAPGATRTIVSTYTVDAAYASANPIVNTATVSSSTPDSNPANDSDDAETLVADPSAADLSVVKVDSPDAAVAGTPVAYTLVVTNHGPATATGVTVTDTLPPGVTLLSTTASQGSCSGTTTVVCTVGTLANGAMATIAVTVRTNSALPTPNPIVNSATVTATTSDPNPANDTDTEPTTIVAQTDLQITKAAPPTITAGSALAFTIVVTNAGPSDAESVVVADPTPPGLTFTSNTGDCTTTFPCALGTVPAGQTRTIVATFAVPSSYTVPDPIANTVTVSSATTETNAANNSASTTTALAFDADLAITKTGPATVIAGHTIAYTLVVTNNGPSDAASVQVSDPTPAGLVFTSNTGDCTTTFPCAFASLAAGETRTIVSTFLVPSGYTTPDPIVNVATVSSATPDSQQGNNGASASTTLGPPSADLSVTKNGPANVVPGDPLTYTITVRNDGPSDAVDVMVADPTPSGLSFDSNTGDCTTAFPCALGLLPAGQTRTISATFLVPAGYTTPQPITNTATVSSATADSNLANNTSTALTSAGTDLVLTKTVDDATPNVTDVVVFTVGIRNAGPSPATGVAVVDAMPAGLTLLVATPSVGDYDDATGRWTIGAMAVNAAATLTLQARVDTSGGRTNTATIVAIDQTDLDTSNNTAGAAVNVPAASDIQVQKTANRAAASVGTEVTFTIVARNAGPDAATGVEITDALPTGLTFVSATPSTGTYDAGTGVWSLGSLAVNATASLTITARIESEGVITNTARVTRLDQFDTATGNDASGVGVNGLAADLQVVKTVNQSSPHVGDRVTFTIAVTNNGPGEATAVRVLDALPAVLSFVGATASQGLYVPETGLWTVGTLAAPGTGGGASSATLQITATVLADGGAVNTARVAGGDQPDPNPANDSSAAPFAAGAIDLDANLTFTGDGTAVGRLFDFFVDVTNRGDRPALAPLVVAIPFPTELAFNAPQTTWPCEAVGRTLFCEHELITPLNENQSQSLAYWADVARIFPRGLVGYAHVASALDPDVTNNVGAVLLTPPASSSANLEVTQTHDVTPTAVGQTVTYRAEVINRGAGAATDVTLVDVLAEGLALVSITPETGTCAGTRRLACAIGTMAANQRVVVTVAARTTATGVIAHTVSVSGREPDADLTNNAARVAVSVAVPAGAPARDSDGDQMTDVWESQMGLNPGLADGGLDPDGDGVTNAEEFARGSHPRGYHRQFFAEGVANPFFGTMFSLVNPNPTRDASILLELMRETGEMTSVAAPLGAMRRQDLVGADLLGGSSGSFSTLVESDQPIASDRLTWWDAHGYGTALETSQAAPSTRWLFAEGATHQFRLFLLLQNPDVTQAADVTIRYLLPSGPPVVKTYEVPAHSRLTIFVNEIPELAATDVSAEILSSRPIVAERAMYRDAGGQLMAAGHAGSGTAAPHTTWLFAEGATGEFFSLYLLLGNPNVAAASVNVRYLLPDGATIEKTYAVGGNARRTIDVSGEDARLASTSVGMTVTSSLPIVAERAMWWPGRRFAPDWYEAHVVAGATEAGTRWALASGAAGGPLNEQTFVLVANQAPTAGRLRVTVVLDTGVSRVQELPIAGNARVTLEIGALVPEAVGHAFSVIVESLGSSPVPIVVEGSRYASPDGQFWGAGAAAVATRLP